MSKAKYVIASNANGIFCKYTTRKGDYAFIEKRREFENFCRNFIEKGYTIKIKDENVLLKGPEELIIIKNYEMIKHDTILSLLSSDIDKTATTKGFIDVSKRDSLSQTPNRIKSNEYSIKAAAAVLTLIFVSSAAIAIESSVKISTLNQEREPIEPTTPIYEEVVMPRILRVQNTESTPSLDNLVAEQNQDEEKIEDLEPTEVDSIEHFSYEEDIDDGFLEFGDESETPKAIKTRELYYDTFEICARDYGLDAEMLLGVATQERGIHSPIEDPNGGIGIMQVQYDVWNDKDITYYKLNKETGNFDQHTLHITDELLKDPTTNIHIGAMILQNYLIYTKYNLPQAIQSYNQGNGAVDNIVSSYCQVTGKDFKEVRYDPEDLGWLDYRYLEPGDPLYLENVNKWLSEHTFTVINVFTGEEVIYRFTNEKDITPRL